MEHAAPLWLEQCMLLSLAFTAIYMWRSVRPPTFLFVAAIVPALVATVLVALEQLAPGTERDQIVTMYACVLAVVVPSAIMMRHQFVRLVRAVFPRAHLVRRRLSRLVEAERWHRSLVKVDADDRCARQAVVALDWGVRRGWVCAASGEHDHDERSFHARW